MFCSLIRPFARGLALLGLVVSTLVLSPGGTLAAQEVLRGRLVGRVVEHEKGKPIEGAEVRIRGTGLMRVSDWAGRFEFEAVPGGVGVLEVSHLSYRVRTDSIQVLPGETVEVEVILSPDPLSLEPLVVSVRSKVLDASGFYIRREQGLSGVLLTREQIEERNPVRFTDLFLSIPGARLAHRDGVGGSVVVFPRGTLIDGATCFPDVWVDGIITTIVDLDQFTPNQVEGLEVYQGAGTPLRYNSPCGAILIWTHVPVKGGGARRDWNSPGPVVCGGELYRSFLVAPWTEWQERVWEVHAESYRIQAAESYAGNSCSNVAKAVHDFQVANDCAHLVYHHPGHQGMVLPDSMTIIGVSQKWASKATNQ